jgi:MFS family permease
MYRLEDLRRVGWTQLFGGMATLIAGIIAQLIVGFSLTQTVANNFIYYVLFAVGWFLFNQIVMAGIYKKLLPDQKRVKLTQLTAPVTTSPTGRFGMPYLRTELIYMAVWVVSVVVIQLLLGSNLTLPLGGFAGGWLVGGGLGRIRFSGKVKIEEVEQDVRFYFGDTMLGPSTNLAYYSAKPEDQPIPTPALAGAGTISSTNLPPGVKRRAMPGSQVNKPGK